MSIFLASAPAGGGASLPLVGGGLLNTYREIHIFVYSNNLK